MGKVKIFVALDNGNMVYRDSEKHQGKSIESSVDPGDKVIWKLDSDSGLSDLELEFMGAEDFFSKGPKKKNRKKWKAVVSKSAKGEISYQAENPNPVESKTAEATTLKSADGVEPPKLKIP